MRPPARIFAGARGAILAALVLCGLAGCVWDVFVAVASASPGAGGADGLGMFFPVVIAGLAIPFQLTAISAFWSASARHRRLAEIEPELIEEAFPPRPGLARVAAVCVATPSLATFVSWVALKVLPYQGGESIWWMLAEPATLLWGPLWAFGGIMAGVAFGREDDRWPLALIPLYPVAGWLYMMF